MLKLVDRPDLGSGVVRRVGSSPTTRTSQRWAPFTDVDGAYFLSDTLSVLKTKNLGTRDERRG